MSVSILVCIGLVYLGCLNVLFPRVFRDHANCRNMNRHITKRARAVSEEGEIMWMMDMCVCVSERDRGVSIQNGCLLRHVESVPSCTASLVNP